MVDLSLSVSELYHENSTKFHIVFVRLNIISLLRQIQLHRSNILYFYTHDGN